MTNHQCPRCGMLALVRNYEWFYCLLCGKQERAVPVPVRVSQPAIEKAEN